MLAMLAASPTPQDPGLRPGVHAGGMLPGLSAEQQQFFSQQQQWPVRRRHLTLLSSADQCPSTLGLVHTSGYAGGDAMFSL